MNRFIIALIACMYCFPAQAETFAPTIGSTFYVSGRVGDETRQLGSVLMLGALMNAKVPNKPNIDIFIDSYGGDVESGYEMIRGIEALKVSGFSVRCVNLGHAVSSAFMIFSHCTERYAVPGATFMFHYPGVTEQNAHYQQLAIDIKRLYVMEKMFVADLMHTLNKSEESIRYNCVKETYWTADALNEYSPGFVKTANVAGLIDIRQVK